VSAHVTLDAEQLRRLGAFLDGLTAIRLTDPGIDPSAYSSMSVSIDGNVLVVEWDAERKQYLVDEQVGS